MQIELPGRPEASSKTNRLLTAPFPSLETPLSIGLVDNSKAGADIIVRAFGERLASMAPGSQVIEHRKLHASLPMAEELFADVSEHDVIISALGDCGSCTSWTVHDSVALEKLGVPVVMVCTEPFEVFARAQATALGMEELRIVVLGHPIAELADAAVLERVDAGFAQFDEFLAEQRTMEVEGSELSKGASSGSTRLVEFEGDDLSFFLESYRLSDGLPVVAPTPERVDAMLAEYQGDHDRELGAVPPRYGVATPRAIAIACVMAGCEPSYFPVVLASTEAVLKPQFNLAGVQATTHPVSFFTLVSGPIIGRIGMNAAFNAFGQGNRANATIGRALRLSMMALGGAWPGDGDMATLGSPAKYTFTAAENVSASPWGSLAESLGHQPDEDVVVVVGAEAPQNVNDHESEDGIGILRMIAGTMRSTGMNNNYYAEGQVVVVMGPEHAQTVAQQGYTRREIQEWLFTEARTPVDYFSSGNVKQRLQTRFAREYMEYGSHSTVPVVHDPDNILICVVGGPGKHSMFIPTFGATKAVTATIV